MTHALTGTVAIVTGASSGIGAATAIALAAEGAEVTLIARRRARLDDLVAQIRASGGRAHSVEADLADAEAATNAVEQVARDAGRIDIIVNNAGMMLVGPVTEAPADEWERMIDINVRAMLAVTRAALPHLVEAATTSPRGVADIVNISSTAGRIARPGNAVYSLTKFGVNAFSESLRQELIPSRVRVGVVEPGSVVTELGTHMRDGIREDFAANRAGVERLQPDDIADAITYVVTRSARVAVNEILVRSREQTW